MYVVNIQTELRRYVHILRMLALGILHLVSGISTSLILQYIHTYRGELQNSIYSYKVYKKQRGSALVMEY